MINLRMIAKAVAIHYFDVEYNAKKYIKKTDILNRHFPVGYPQPENMESLAIMN